MDKGFTLIEMIIVLALVSVIAGLGLAVSMDSYRAAIFRSEQQMLVSMLRQARASAMDNQDDLNHTIRIATHSIGLDEYTPIAIAAMATSTASDVIFNCWSGNLANPVTINLVSGRHKATITINQQGRIND